MAQGGEVAVDLFAGWCVLSGIKRNGMAALGSNRVGNRNESFRRGN